MKEAEDVFSQLETDEPDFMIHDLPYVFAFYCNPRGYAYLCVALSSPYGILHTLLTMCDTGRNATYTGPKCFNQRKEVTFRER